METLQMFEITGFYKRFPHKQVTIRQGYIHTEGNEYGSTIFIINGLTMSVEEFYKFKAGTNVTPEQIRIMSETFDYAIRHNDQSLIDAIELWKNKLDFKSQSKN